MTFKYIKINPEICSGSPCLVGTRLPVHIIKNRIDSGDTLLELFEEYAYIGLPLIAFEQAINYAKLHDENGNLI